MMGIWEKRGTEGTGKKGEREGEKGMRDERRKWRERVGNRM